MNTPLHADLIIEARWIIPIEPAGLVLENHSVVITQGRISALLPTHQARENYCATHTRELPNHVLIPGLVNAHTHAAMTLLRGAADNLPLMRWLQEAIWPLEQKLVSSEFVYDGTTLAAAEMLSSGITTCCDMYFYPDAAARAFTDAGMRAVLGLCVLDSPSNFAADADDYLNKGLAARDKWKEHPLLNFTLAPHAPYTVSNQTLERIGTLAEELDIGIHIHLHETQQEISDSLTQHGVRPLQRLQALGLAGPSLHVTHAVHMSEGDLDILTSNNISVSHNPTSNLKLASGIAPIPSMLARKINVALGTDGAASNNRLDILQEMRLGALLAKASGNDASILPAHQALRMATLSGAQALGLQADIGSIETGKLADLCAISLAASSSQPCYDIASHLVYVIGREAITDVWVGGQARVISGDLLHSSHNELLRISRLWQNAAKR